MEYWLGLMYDINFECEYNNIINSKCIINNKNNKLFATDRFSSILVISHLLLT
jgi:hypothetical protein